MYTSMPGHIKSSYTKQDKNMAGWKLSKLKLKFGHKFVYIKIFVINCFTTGISETFIAAFINLDTQQW